MNPSTESVLSAVPAELQAEVAAQWEAYSAAAAEAGLTPPAQADFLRIVGRVWAGSDFVARACARDPGLLDDLLVSGDLLGDYAVGELRSKAERALAAVTDDAELALALRQLRRREMVRIAWRDLAGWARVEEVLEDLSALADACVNAALDTLYAWQCRELGTPMNTAGITVGAATGQPQRLVVLGMGKLGARELNFSSDIDLIFAFPEAGQDLNRRRGRRGISHEEFFIRLSQRLIQALNDVTAAGFVYRVDMRLRPYGDSGPMAMSFAALEDYYQSQGREWERYAMVKARALAGAPEAIAELEELLRPFVYRRYLDFGAFEQLREMKVLIQQELERRGLRQDIKLGPGGIREVEFIAQAFQLVRGGREPLLRERSLLTVLSRLAQLYLLPAYAAERLAEAYRFLRRVENRLQAYADEQTHQLPEDDTARLRLAFTLGYPDWDTFLRALDKHRRFVHGQFEQVFSAPQAAINTSINTATNAPSATSSSDANFAALWTGVSGADAVRRLFATVNEDDCEEILRRLNAFRDGPALRTLGTRGRPRMDRLMPLLLGAVSKASDPAQTFVRVLAVIEAIAGRSAYLALLVENPMALSQLVRLCAASPWIAERLARYPLLLDELLDPRHLYTPPQRTDLERQLALRMAQIDAEDLEQQMDALRQFQKAAVLRVAAADVLGATPLMRVSDHLTDLAEVILKEVLALCWAHMVRRHGVPGGCPEGRRQPAGFAIIAYGKLGGIELGYGSDLDLVFLHAAQGGAARTDGDKWGAKPLDTPVFFARLGQRIIHLLNTLTPAGVLYEVDMRWRPSGASGLLVTSLEAFADYQRNEAWTWEHQALVRARPVAGDAVLGEAFATVRREVLGRSRDPRTVQREVREMRERMRQELADRDPERFDLKQGVGGIADIEFMVQYLVLRYAHDHPNLLVWSDNIRLLEMLGADGLLAPGLDLPGPGTPGPAELLAEAYRRYRKRVHELTLQELPALVAADEFRELRAQVTALWQRVMTTD
ncbi:MAG: bifunctional [glutamate--ammonia ligase]-adenylyl-L-tyrosine phosphorylase/[glutamate--ammonia-ligase] adenylyltransferase [Gammaproteobacteria bacterium]|nr:bifunctional [glutamate--ammonia ligase]-adenylyl-L-tyrosine phosphorylase/[glutamate--ammonia-ligase] adenylyltransferase [Gammaproteobacteria bacterium]